MPSSTELEGRGSQIVFARVGRWVRARIGLMFAQAALERFHGSRPWKVPKNFRRALAELAGRSVSAFGSPLRRFLPHSDGVDDQIHIEQLGVFAHIGVPDNERSSPQCLTFNITLWPSHNAPELGDAIARTVNYAAVCAETKSFVQARSDRLIETLADALANHLLAVFEMRRITIELRKFILPDVKFVSVTVTRERSTK